MYNIIGPWWGVSPGLCPTFQGFHDSRMVNQTIDTQNTRIAYNDPHSPFTAR